MQIPQSVIMDSIEHAQRQINSIFRYLSNERGIEVTNVHIIDTPGIPTSVRLEFRQHRASEGVDDLTSPQQPPEK